MFNTLFPMAGVGARGAGAAGVPGGQLLRVLQLAAHQHSVQPQQGRQGVPLRVEAETCESTGKYL